MPGSVTERDLDPKRTKALKERVLNGTALSFIWARAKVLATGEVFRVNGNHSSNMLAGLNGSMPEGLMVHIDDYEVTEVNGLATLFRQFDYRGSSRNIADISGAYQMLVPDLRDVPKARARKAVEGVCWYLRRIIGDNAPRGDDIYGLFNQDEYHPFVRMVGRIYTSKTSEFTTPVIGAMYGTFDVAPDEAETFWDAVAHEGGGNDDKHPATVLDAWLMQNKDAKDKLPDMAVYRGCALAWNAYRNHRNLDRITRFDSKKGIPDLA
jgi:hypothetical protein